MPEVRAIDANKLRNKICAACAERLVCIDMGNICFEVACIDDAPTVEPEVRHGQWSEMICYKEHGIEMADYECTNCGGEITKQRGYTPKYCEHCGAEMNGGAENA